MGGICANGSRSSFQLPSNTWIPGAMITTPTCNYPLFILELLQLQTELGWQQMFERFTHWQWEETQSNYYQSIRSLR